MNRGAILIPQCIGYLLEGHALKAHRACLLRPLIVLLVALPEHREGYALARSLKVKRWREPQLEGVETMED